MGAPIVPSAPFATVDLLGEYLQEDFTTSALAALALLGATQAIQSYCDQYIAFLADDTVVIDGSGSDVVLLPEIPVTDVAEVIIDIDQASPTTLTAVDYGVTSSGLLVRRRGTFEVHAHGATFGKWPNRKQSIQVTYSHGYDVTGVALAGRSAVVLGDDAATHIPVPGFNPATDTLLTVVDTTADGSVSAIADLAGIKVTTDTSLHNLLVTWNTPVPTMPADLQMVTVAVAARALAQDGATQETTGAYTALYAGQPGVLTKDEQRVCDRYRTRRK